MIRLGLFALALAAVFAAAAGVGRLADADAPAAAAGHADDGGHETPPAGLAVEQDGFRLVAEVDRLRAGDAGSYTFAVVGPDGTRVRDYEVEHERRLHLIVVRRELDWFLHVHPRLRPDGLWETTLRLPVGGAYRVYADFTVDGERRTLGHDLLAEGASGTPVLAEPAVEATLERDGERLVFDIRRDGAPVEVEPYLGARGHLVVLRRGDLAYVHAHADEDELAFDVPFPSEGDYRLFLQVKVGGSVHTIPLDAHA